MTFCLFHSQFRAPSWMAIGAVGCLISTTLAACSTLTTSQYEATARVRYVWQVQYVTNSDGKRPRIEQFESTTLTNLNGQRPDDAVTGPDDQGLWWPAVPPRPTVDEVEARQEPNESVDSIELQKDVSYMMTFEMDGQTRIMPTNYSVYRQVVKALPNQQLLELTLGVNDGSVLKAEPQ